MRTAKLLLLALCALLSACSDDDDYAENYRRDLVDVTTDGGGNVRQLTFDDGTVRTPIYDFATTFRDTTFRAAAVFISQTNGVEMRSLSRIFTDAPRMLADTLVKTDPVKVFSVWRGGRYVNFYLGLMTGGTQSHYLGFIDRGVTTGASGVKTLHLQLYHDQHADALNYTRETYVSCRVDELTDPLSAGDSIEVTCATFSGTQVTRLPL